MLGSIVSPLLTVHLQFVRLLQIFLHDIVVSQTCSVSVSSGSLWIDIVTWVPLATLYSLLNNGRCANSGTVPVK